MPSKVFSVVDCEEALPPSKQTLPRIDRQVDILEDVNAVVRVDAWNSSSGVRFGGCVSHDASSAGRPR